MDRVNDQISHACPCFGQLPSRDICSRPCTRRTRFIALKVVGIHLIHPLWANGPCRIIERIEHRRTLVLSGTAFQCGVPIHVLLDAWCVFAFHVVMRPANGSYEYVWASWWDQFRIIFLKFTIVVLDGVCTFFFLFLCFFLF